MYDVAFKISVETLTEWNYETGAKNTSIKYSIYRIEETI